MQIDRTKLISALQSNSKKNLKSYLLAQPECGIFHTNLLKFGNYSFTVDFSFLAEWLLARAKKIGAEKAADDFIKFLKVDEIPGIAILAVNGIIIDEPLELSESIQLIPYKELPDSLAKASHDPYSIADDSDCPPILKNNLRLHKYYGTSQIRPSAALICPVLSYPKFLPKQPDLAHIQSRNTIDTTIRKLLEACSCLTLVGPSSPTPMTAWWEADEWIPCCRWYGHSGSSPVFDLINHSGYQFTTVDKEKAKKIHDEYSKLNNDIKVNLAIPLERLNRATRRIEPVDKAIELGIAMEAIFLNDLSDKGELSFKLKLRAAWLLSKNNSNDRHELMKRFGILYDLRSKAVHDGKLPSRTKGYPTDELLKKGAGDIACAIEYIIENGWPFWDNLVLGQQLT